MPLSYGALQRSRRYSQVLVAASLAVANKIVRRQTDRDWRTRPLATSLAAAAASKVAVARGS